MGRASQWQSFESRIVNAWRALTGKAVDAATPDDAPPPSKSATGASDGSGHDATTASMSQTEPKDRYAEDKARLRTLATWIVGIFGAIAAVMVAGSQLADLGSLDATAKVSLFGWERTRFEFAVIGLAVLLGGTAVVVALCVWVQTTTDASIESICSCPQKKKWWYIWGWRVRARVREDIEADLARRGEDISGPEHNRSRFNTVIERWKTSRLIAVRATSAAVELQRELTVPRAPRGNRSCDVVDWTDGAKLKDLAHDLQDRQPSVIKTPDSFTVLEAQMNANLDNAVDDVSEQFDLVDVIIHDASWLRMRRSFGMVLKYIVGSAVFVGIGIALFAWSTHPPKTDSRQTAVIIIPAATIKDSRTYLGKDCDPTTVKIDALGDTKLVALSAASSEPSKTCSLTPPATNATTPTPGTRSPTSPGH